MDAALSEVLFFKLFWAETATGTVATPAIVIALDIIKHRRLHYFPVGKVLSVDTFHFQRVEKALYAGIAVTASLCAHTPSHIMAFQHELIRRHKGNLTCAPVSLHDEMLASAMILLIRK